MKNNQEKSRFEIEENGLVTFANYNIDGKKLVITHVEAPVEARGTGSAGRLMQEVAQHAKQKKDKEAPKDAAFLHRNIVVFNSGKKQAHFVQNNRLVHFVVQLLCQFQAFFKMIKVSGGIPGGLPEANILADQPFGTLMLTNAPLVFSTPSFKAACLFSMPYMP